MSISAIQRVLTADCDPETLVGPLFYLFTRMAQQRGAEFSAAMREHLLALALHPAVAIEVRLMAGGIAADLAANCVCADTLPACGGCDH